MDFIDRITIFTICAAALCGCSLMPDDAPEYTVSIFQGGKWNDAWVYEALVSDFSRHDEIWNDWDNSKSLRDTMSVALFEDDFDSPVRVRVSTTRKFSKCRVRPTCADVDVRKVDERTVEFTLPSFDVRKVSVEFDGNRQENLFVVGNRKDLEKPSEDDPDVLYFGPGEHYAGKMSIGDGQTVYVDYGAVLHADFVVSGNDVRIAGNGIITGSGMKHWGNDSYACGDVLFEVGPKGRESLSGFTMENVTLIDSPSWTVYLNNVRDIRIDNINIINWILNGDGIDLVCCRDAIIKDCFLRCYDDCITLKVNHGNRTDCCNIEIDGCLIWEDIARGIVVGPEAGNADMSPGRIHDVDIHDCIFLEHRGTSEGDNVRAALSICQWRHPVEAEGHAAEISDVVCRNLYFDDISSDGTYIYVWQMAGQSEGCCIRNLTFENIFINDENNVRNPVFQAITNENHIEGLTIENFNISGRKIMSEGRDFICKGNFSELSFR